LKGIAQETVRTKYDLFPQDNDLTEEEEQEYTVRMVTDLTEDGMFLRGAPDEQVSKAFTQGLF
jgi:hypothetical protein